MNKTAKNNNSLYVQPTHLHSTVTPIHLIIHKLDAVLHLLRRKEFGLANHGWKSHEMMQLNFPIRTIALWWSTAHKRKHKIIGVFFDSTHDPQHCWMQKHPFPCSGSGKQAVWVADLPSPSWRLQAQRAELLTPRLSPASLHHPWLSSAWWAFLRLWLHWHVDSVMALPSKQKGTHSLLNGVKRLNVYKNDILLHYISSALNCDRI